MAAGTGTRIASKSEIEAMRKAEREASERFDAERATRWPKVLELTRAALPVMYKAAEHPRIQAIVDEARRVAGEALEVLFASGPNGEWRDFGHHFNEPTRWIPHRWTRVSPDADDEERAVALVVGVVADGLREALWALSDMAKEPHEPRHVARLRAAVAALENERDTCGPDRAIEAAFDAGRDFAALARRHCSMTAKGDYLVCTQHRLTLDRAYERMIVATNDATAAVVTAGHAEAGAPGGLTGLSDLSTSRCAQMEELRALVIPSDGEMYESRSIADAMLHAEGCPPGDGERLARRRCPFLMAPGNERYKHAVRVVELARIEGIIGVIPASDSDRSGNQAVERPIIRQEIFLWPGAEHSERNIRLARTRSAYLEAHGDVAAARKALDHAGHRIGRSTFYDHLDALDAADPDWRRGVLSGSSGNPEKRSRSGDAGLHEKTRGKRR